MKNKKINPKILRKNTPKIRQNHARAAEAPASACCDRQRCRSQQADADQGASLATKSQKKDKKPPGHVCEGLLNASVTPPPSAIWSRLGGRRKKRICRSSPPK